jgi:serine/threonine protein kinase
VIGQILGHCRILAKIGEGGMGTVYRAYDEVLHRDVAVKVVNKDARLDPSSSQRLLHEARASSSLAHPNICTIHDVGENEGEFYIVMELVEGKSLAGMAEVGGLAPESVLRYGVQIASALARAHDRGIVHRDLKAANILITNEGLIKVLDFGLAKQAGSGIFEGPTRSVCHDGGHVQRKRHFAVYGARNSLRQRGRPSQRLVGSWRRALRSGFWAPPV